MLMRNINGYPSKCVQRLYDLKGSTISRKSIKDPKITKAELKEQGVLKDLDFETYEDGVLPIHQDLKPTLAKTLKKDSEFLRSLGLMDYSLIIFVVDKKKLTSEDPDPSSFSVLTNLNSHNLSQEETLILQRYREIHENAPEFTFNPFFSMKSQKEDVFFHIGLVDYLDSFKFGRRAEMYWKRISKCNWKLDTSVQPPNPYAQRFQRYVDKICSKEGEQISIFDLSKDSVNQRVSTSNRVAQEDKPSNEETAKIKNSIDLE